MSIEMYRMAIIEMVNGISDLEVLKKVYAFTITYFEHLIEGGRKGRHEDVSAKKS